MGGEKKSMELPHYEEKKKKKKKKTKTSLTNFPKRGSGLFWSRLKESDERIGEADRDRGTEQLNNPRMRRK